MADLQLLARRAAESNAFSVHLWSRSKDGLLVQLWSREEDGLLVQVVVKYSTSDVLGRDFAVVCDYTNAH